MLSIFFDEIMDKDFVLNGTPTGNNNNTSPKEPPSTTSLVKPSSSSSSSSNASNYNSHSYGGYNASNYNSTTYSYTSMDPKEVFTYDKITFIGTAKNNLDKLVLGEKDLIINCTGVTYEASTFVKKTPEWLNLNSINPNFSQLVFDWKDFGVPPTTFTKDKWLIIFEQAKLKGIERIICCCQAGQGRTGTALAIFYGLLHPSNDFQNSIEFIREKYSSKAIENSSQERYILKTLGASEQEINNLIKSVTSSVVSTSPTKYL